MTTLNDKIYKLLEEWDCVVRDCDCACDFEATHNTADEIEKLILQEKLDLLDWVLSEIDFSNNTDYLLLKDTQSKLFTELNKLK